MTDSAKLSAAYARATKPTPKQADSHDFELGLSEGGEVCAHCGGPVGEDGMSTGGEVEDSMWRNGVTGTNDEDGKTKGFLAAIKRK